MALLFMIAVMGVCVALVFAMVEGAASLLRKPRSPVRRPALALIPVEERRAMRVRFVGAERRRQCWAADPHDREQRYRA